MQRLGTNMTALTYGLLTDDSAAVRIHAASIAEHAPISESELERIRGILGGEMGGFERLDASVHESAVRLSVAAAGADPSATVTALADVQRGCVECHARFRERLRTSP